MVKLYKLKCASILTGKDLHTHSTRQRHQRRQTSHRLQISAALPQNVEPTLFNTLPVEKNDKLGRKS